MTYHPFTIWWHKSSGWGPQHSPEDSLSEGRLAIDAWNAAIDTAKNVVHPDENAQTIINKIEQLRYIRD